MVRRVSWRIPIQIHVTLYCGSRTYSGTVTNISESGMFIRSDEMILPKGSQFNVSIPTKEETLDVPVKLIRNVKKDDVYEGMGVELLNPPKGYLDFVENLLFVL